MKKSEKNVIGNAVLAAGCAVATGLSCHWVKKDVEKTIDKKKPATFSTHSEYSRDVSALVTFCYLTMYYLEEVVDSVRKKN